MNGKTKKPAPAPDEDSALVKAFQAGRKAAFDDLVIRHKNRLFNLCYWFLGDYHEANDSSQETFIKAYRRKRPVRNKKPHTVCGGRSDIR